MVNFPRLGWLTVVFVSARNERFISFRFEDKWRAMPVNRVLQVAKRQSFEAYADDIVRIDQESGRASLCSSNLGLFADIRKSFEAIRRPYFMESAETVARQELRRGARLFTANAEYFKVKEFYEENH